ncbi:MAG TPA: DinB family protein [Acidimicrobiales bacterium]|nr:DinB family protein [Acidimicrobiales bacterium]
MDYDQERADLLDALRTRRQFLRFTVNGLSDEQARARTTASGLCLGGLIKHVAEVERRWANFITEGPSAMAWDPSAASDYARGFELLEGESLAGVLDVYEKVGSATDVLVMDLPGLDMSQPLPEAPWFEPGASRSARQVFLHIIAETSQHAGHADIIRESLDGQKTMG